MKNDNEISSFFRLISGILLILAIGYQASTYYVFLRWIVCGSSIYSGWVFFKTDKSNWSWFLFIIGIVFNPIMPLYLDKLLWQMIDIFSAVLMFMSLKVIPKKTNE